MLLADLEDKIRPNMKLLKSLGFFGDSLGNLLSIEPSLLSGDLVDSIEFFRAQGFSDKQVTVLTMKKIMVFW